MTTKDERQDAPGHDGDTVEILNPDGPFPCLILCDHAASALPADYDGLGLTPEDLNKHIGIDIGIADVVRTLSDRLGAPALLTRHSRLLVDCNRWTEDPRLMLAESDGIAVPGNVGITGAERRHRLDAYYWPYHAAVAEAMRRLRARHRFPLLLSLHSCTRRLGAEFRKWDAGTIWHESDSLADALVAALRQEQGLLIGDNEPYSGKGGTFTIDYHSWGTGVPACGLEIVNDHLRAPQDQARWVARIETALKTMAAASETIWRRHADARISREAGLVAQP